MDRVKKVYVNSSYETDGSVSDTDFKFEIREAWDLGDNTVCNIDDISIPHTWYTIGNYNNQLCIETANNPIANASIVTIPNGNYTASSLASTLTLTLQSRFPEIGYNNNVGTIKTTNSSSSLFSTLADETVVSLQGINWYGDDGEHHLYSHNMSNLRSINEVFRNSGQSPSGASYESGFIDLLNVHNLYIYIYSFPESGKL